MTLLGIANKTAAMVDLIKPVRNGDTREEVGHLSVIKIRQGSQTETGSSTAVACEHLLPGSVARVSLQRRAV